MKTSEFIRAAIDAYLSPSPECDHFSTTETKYLCHCFSMFNDSQQYQYVRQCSAALTAIQELSNSMYSGWSVIFNAAHAAKLLAPGEYDELEASGGMQQIRFMLAEFIALQFEDLGD